MRHFWARTDVKFESIVLIVKEFFSSRGFVEGLVSKTEETKNTLLFETCIEKKYRSVNVEVFERSDGFEIDLGPYETAESLARIGTLPTLFGGGLLIRRRLESFDPSFYERLEVDFIDFVGRKIEGKDRPTDASSTSG